MNKPPNSADAWQRMQLRSQIPVLLVPGIKFIIPHRKDDIDYLEKTSVHFLAKLVEIVKENREMTKTGWEGLVDESLVSSQALFTNE